MIDLSAGQVVEPLPEPARQALAKTDRVTAYAARCGQIELRTAVAGHYRRRTGLSVSPDDITITAGARHGLFATIAATAASGEALVPKPHWSHYPKVIRLATAEPVAVPGDPAAGWLTDSERLERAFTSRTKAVIINSPVNPTGAIYGESAMRSIRRWATDRGVSLIVDDVYWAFGGSAGRTVQATGREVVVGGAAKAHALAGLRIGWVWSPPHLTEAIREVVEYTTGPVSTLSQAAVAVILGDDDGVRDRVARLAALREHAVAVFSAVPMVRVVVPAGGIYLCLDASAVLRHRLFGAADDRALCHALADQAGVRFRPGSTFGLPGHLRLCVAATPEVLAEAGERLARSLLIQRERFDDDQQRTRAGQQQQQPRSGPARGVHAQPAAQSRRGP